MALRTILTYEDDALHKVCREVTEFDGRLAELLDDLHETLTEAQGAGLAAPQVGILRRALVMDYDGKYYELVNPEIVSKSGHQRVLEGCLSCPGQGCVLNRPKKVVVKAKDRNGKDVKYLFSGFYAKLACHEIDHLDGIIILDIKEKFFDPETDKNLD